MKTKQIEHGMKLSQQRLDALLYDRAYRKAVTRATGVNFSSAADTSSKMIINGSSRDRRKVFIS
jgi:hypothetical protein